jgi:hypothetical protein
VSATAYQFAADVATAPDVKIVAHDTPDDSKTAVPAAH